MIRQPRRLPLLSLMLVVGSLSGCFTDDKGGGATPDGLSGQVRLGGRPVADAKVTAIPVDYRPGTADAQTDPKAYFSATTGAGGVYAFADIPAGRYNILATGNGQMALLDSVAVTGNDQSLPTLALTPPGALVGRIELQPRHSTLGSVVEVLGTPVFATVDEDGDFELAGLAPGAYRLRASTDLPDYSPDFLAAMVTTGSADTLATPLRPSYSGTPSPGVSGRLRDTHGDAAVGATVWAYPADFVPGDAGADSVPYFSDTTGPGGIYIFEDVPQGVYNILASRNSWMAYRSRVEVTGLSQSLPADTLKLPGILGGRVIMQEGHPAIAAVVQVMGTPVVATVDDQGHFQLPPLAPGTYRLRAHSTLIPYAPAIQEAVIRSGTGYLLEEPLRPVYSGTPIRLLIGRLLNDRGPAVGAKVRICPVDYVPVETALSDSATSGYFTATAGAGGIYAFTDVPAGLYNILIGNTIFRDSVTVTGTIQSLPLETERASWPIAGRVLLQPNHPPESVTVQVLGTPIAVKVREDSSFQLPLGPGTYRLRVLTSLPDYAPVTRDVIHPAQGASLEPFRPRYSGIPVVFGLSAVPGPEGTVVFSWDKPEYDPVEEYLIYRDTVQAPEPSEAPYVRVGGRDTAWIDTVYSRVPRAGQYDYADTTHREHIYRVRILNGSGEMGPLFYSVRGGAVPPAARPER